MSRRNPTRISLLLTLLLCSALLVAGCDSSLTVDIGSIRVSVTAVGNNIDPDGYTVRVNGDGEDQIQPVDVNGAVLFGVPSGRYTVTLGAIASNCIVDLNPQGVNVSSGSTAEVLFNTLCG